MTFPALHGVFTLAARASRQEKLLALTGNRMIKDLKIKFLKAILKSPVGMGDRDNPDNNERSAALPSPVHGPGKLCKPTCTGAEAMVMGWGKQSSGSHHGYSQPQNPQNILICCLQGLFLMDKGLSRVPHQRVHKGGFSSPILPFFATTRSETAPKSLSLCLAKTSSEITATVWHLAVKNHLDLVLKR